MKVSRHILPQIELCSNMQWGTLATDCVRVRIAFHTNETADNRVATELNRLNASRLVSAAAAVLGTVHSLCANRNEIEHQQNCIQATELSMLTTGRLNSAAAAAAT